MGVEPYTPPGLMTNTIAPSQNDINFNLGSLWLNTISYQVFILESVSQGVAAWNPLAFMVPLSRAPLSTDNNYAIGTFWWDTSNEQLYILQSVASSSPYAATWVSVVGSTESLAGDSGGAVHPDSSGNINILAQGTGMTFVGDPSDSTLTLEWPEEPTNKQVLAGVTSGVPTFLTLTSVGETITITQTSSTINLESTGEGSSSIISITGDLEGPITGDVDDNINLYGGLSGMVFLGDESTNSLTLEWPTEGTDGQVLIGATDAAPLFASLTSDDGSITYTAGANSLDLSVTTQIGTPQSWTPEFSWVSMPSLTYSVQNGTYQQIGNVVVFSCNVGLNMGGTTPAGTGLINIVGLPFSVYSGAGFIVPCSNNGLKSLPINSVGTGFAAWSGLFSLVYSSTNGISHQALQVQNIYGTFSTIFGGVILVS